MGIGNTMTNMKIGTRLTGAFGVILALLAVMAGIVSFNLLESRQLVGEYRSTAMNSNQLSRVQAEVLTTRIYTKDVIAGANRTVIDSARAGLAAAIGLIDETMETIVDPDQARRLKTLHEMMETYGAGIDQVVDLDKRARLLERDLRGQAASLTAEVDTLMSAMADDVDASWTISVLTMLSNDIEGMLGATLEFTESRNADHMKDALAANAKIADHLDTLRGAADAAALQRLSATQAEFQAGVGNLNALFAQRTAATVGTLERIGPEAAELIDTMRDAYEEIQDGIGSAMQSNVETSLLVAVSVSAVMVLLGALAAVVIGRSIARPIIALTRAMGRLSEGDLDADIPSTEQKDEIGLMARAVQVFKENMIRAKALEAEEERQQEARDRRAEAVERAIQDFQTRIAERLDALRGVSDELSHSADTLTGVAAETKEQSTNAAAASGQTAANVQSVSAAAEEMDSSFGEIVGQVTRASTSVETTSDRARDTLMAIEELKDQSESIVQVVELINSIADQTNLLALNATIEAARAGDAGKGFAVVASEVKSLATQTGKATEEIAEKIRRVQASCVASVEAVREIVDRIEEVNSISAAIAAAVEEQKAATSEITRNMLEAARGTEQLSESITRVSDATDRTSVTVGGVTEAARQTSTEAGEIKTAIDRFIHEVQAA
ncbi:methyl-accepting chemotaxis protein [Thalassobaculum sp. OXR-137]|uniref:HAMP domain-containing methyl-accepting chemotaxis protein n=1 Tax=Thalassobaculum sp. OXR-137 TaxID=3100173 RepID=UPI002AC912BA|nr:methyl-accepting chemotaxis protein [Thalassobaculum sp. OXR-137]WPZ34852.1 methyl-accepting chemotaxis protein [Thalassobaculum sp. OXR-137]